MWWITHNIDLWYTGLGVRQIWGQAPLGKLTHPLGTAWGSLNDLYIFFFFFFLWLCWVFIYVWGLSLVVASGGHSSSRCAGLSLSQPLLLQSTGSRRAGSVIVAHGPSCSAACGIFPDQGSNPCPLHWQADSQPLRYQGSPSWLFLKDNTRALETISKATFYQFIN